MVYDYDRRTAKNVAATSPIAHQLLGAFIEGKRATGNMHELKAAASRLAHVAAKAAESPFQPSLIAVAPIGLFEEMSNAIIDLTFEMGAASIKPETKK